MREELLATRLTECILDRKHAVANVQQSLNPDSMVYAYGRNYIDLIETLLSTEDTDRLLGCATHIRGGFVRIQDWKDRVAKVESCQLLKNTHKCLSCCALEDRTPGYAFY